MSERSGQQHQKSGQARKDAASQPHDGSMWISRSQSAESPKCACGVCCFDPWIASAEPHRANASYGRFEAHAPPPSLGAQTTRTLTSPKPGWLLPQQQHSRKARLIASFRYVRRQRRPCGVNESTPLLFPELEMTWRCRNGPPLPAARPCSSEARRLHTRPSASESNPAPEL
jgi:hypothetical protein